MTNGEVTFFNDKLGLESVSVLRVSVGRPVIQFFLVFLITVCEPMPRIRHTVLYTVVPILLFTEEVSSTLPVEIRWMFTVPCVWRT